MVTFDKRARAASPSAGAARYDFFSDAKVRGSPPRSSGMEIARALVLAAPTAEDRPWSSTGTGPKPLVPIATKPIVFHALEALRSAGVREVALLTEPHTAELYEAAVGDGSRWDMAVRYVACKLDTDMRAALCVTRDFIDGEPVLVQRADALIREQLREHIVRLARDNLDAIALMVGNGRVTPESLPRVAGGYLLSPHAVSVLRDAVGARDPLARLRRNGSEVRVFDVEGCLACDGSEVSLLDANRHALGAIQTDTGGVELDGSEIQGPVRIHPSATLRNTLVRGPAVIGPRTRIVDSYVGPYSSIGADVRIEGTEIEHSIVMDAAQLLFVGSRLETSIIGRGASIVRRFDMPTAVRMSIGDGARVALS
jgi:glucose-1-phosphate thymidylyltransferase